MGEGILNKLGLKIFSMEHDGFNIHYQNKHDGINEQLSISHHGSDQLDLTSDEIGLLKLVLRHIDLGSKLE